MKKNLILSVLMLSVMLMVVGSVSAVSDSFYSQSGVDTTGYLSSHTLTSGELDDVDTSDNNRYESYSNWEFQTFEDTEAIDFYNFDILFPSNLLSIDSVVLNFEWHRDQYSIDGARIRVWDDSDSSWHTYNLPAPLPNSDRMENIDLSSHIDNIDDLENIIIRFQAHNGGGTLRTDHDLVEIEVDYTVDNEAPVIENIQTEYYIPCEEDVTVCADVTDVSDILSVVLDCDAGSSGGWDVMSNTGGDTYCGTVSAITLGAEDGLEVDCEITAEDEHSNLDSVLLKPIIYDCADPSGDFVCSPLSGDEPLTTDCDATFTDVSPLTYAWTFTGGDPSSSTDEDPTGIEYVQDGFYTVILSVTDSVGRETEIIKNDYIEVFDTGPVASFTYSGVLVEGYEVEFLDTSTSYDGIVSWDWDFDDTGTSSEQDPSHTFADDGTYSVSLTVCEADADCDTYTEDLEILPINPLPDQEVAAYYELGYTFDTGFSGPVTCTGFTTLPVGMTLTGNIDGTCTVNWVPTNDQQGTYTDIVVEVSGSGSEYYSFDITVYSWIISLQSGWNLISIPLVPEDTSIDAVILDQLGTGGQDILPGGTEYVIYSYQFDGTSSNWLKSRESGYGYLDHVVPGYGYWIKANAEGKLRGFGTQLGQNSPGMPPEIEVPTNHWSLIGKYGILGTTPGEAGSLPKPIALNSINKPFGNQLNVYEVDGLGHLNLVSNLFNNEGYWLWIKNLGSNNAVSETYAPIDSYYPQN